MKRDPSQYPFESCELPQLQLGLKFLITILYKYIYNCCIYKDKTSFFWYKHLNYDFSCKIFLNLNRIKPKSYEDTEPHSPF